MKIYGDKISGNCYKIQLVCHLLDIPYEWVHVDVVGGDARTPDFVAQNPNAKVPIIELDNGTILCESNAIINYLAQNSPLYPPEALLQAHIQQWQFFEQYSHEPFIAVRRFIQSYLNMPEERLAEYQAKEAGGYKALEVMEQQLTQSKFLIGEGLTTADIALYAYTHVCHEGGFSLDRFPAIQNWINHIQSQPAFIPMGSI